MTTRDQEHTDIAERIERHIEETRAQAQTVRECIEQLGESVSATKPAFANMFGDAGNREQADEGHHAP